MEASPRTRQRRPKISLACEPCRERKSRCDGRKPICLSCQRRRLPLEQCVYKTANARTASTDDYVRVLHDRIRQLEQACEKNNVTIPPLVSGDVRLNDPDNSEGFILAQQRGRTTGASPGSAPPGGHEREGGSRGPSTHPPTGRDRFSIHHLISSLPPEDAESDMSSGVTAMGTISQDDVDTALSTTQEFYGGSSAASLMKDAYAGIDSPSTRRPASATREKDSTGRSRDAHIPRIHLPDAGKFVLPPRAVADELLATFWARVHPTCPFLYRPAFEQAYRINWHTAPEYSPSQDLSGVGVGSGPEAGPASAVFHASLNVMLALGCLFSGPPSRESVCMARVFFMRGRGFVNVDLMDVGDVGVVQALLLMALFLQSTSYAHRCWVSVGVACRIAQALGLHDESARAHRSRSPLEVEVRRRTWHACLVLDTLVCVTFGRPAMATGVSQPPLPSTQWPRCGSQDSTTNQDPSTMIFSIEHIKLCRILGDVLSKTSNPPLDGASRPLSHGRQSRSQHMELVLDLDSRLSEFERGVQPLLSWTHSGDAQHKPTDGSEIISVQRTILYARFLYIRLMLFRPFLTQVYASNNRNTETSSSAPAVGDQTLYASFAFNCAQRCLRTSVELASVVHESHRRRATEAWWWNGLYACTSALTLVVARRDRQLFQSVDGKSLDKCWEHCQDVLEHLASFSESGRKSLVLLSRIYDVVQSDSDSTTRSGGAFFAQNRRVNSEEGTTVHTEPQAAGVGDPDFFNLDMDDGLLGIPGESIDGMLGGTMYDLTGPEDVYMGCASYA